MRRSVPEAERYFRGDLGAFRIDRQSTVDGCRLPSLEFFGSIQNYVDTAFVLPQYLVLRTLPIPQVGWRVAIGTTFARENRSRRNLHGNEEEGKKEETLTVCETILRTCKITSLSGEAPLERRFLSGAISNWQLA
jgi:hypothetical protein